MTFRFSVAFLAFALQSVAASAGDSSLSVQGKWSSDFGEMELTEAGGVVTGRYSFEGGKVVGTLSGTRLTGHWIQSKSSRKCETSVEGSHFHGKMDFEFTGDKFTGKWGYCNDALAEQWSGVRVVEKVACTQCPAWVAQSLNGSLLPLASEADSWSDAKPFNRKSGPLTVQSRFKGQKGTTCNFDVQFNNTGSSPIDERVLVARPDKAAVGTNDQLVSIKLSPGTSYAFGTEIRQCPLNWGETKEMKKCAECEPTVYFLAD